MKRETGYYWVKKPVKIEAIQFNDLNREEIENFVGKPLKIELESETAYLAGQGPPIFSILIETKEGVMKAMPGDWVIKEPFPTGDRDFYSCKKSIFEQTYNQISMPDKSILEDSEKELSRMVDFHGFDRTSPNNYALGWRQCFDFLTGRIPPPDQVRGEETNEDWIVAEAKLYLKELQLRNTQDPVDVDEMFINDFAVFGKRIKSALSAQPRPSDSGTAKIKEIYDMLYAIQYQFSTFGQLQLSNSQRDAYDDIDEFLKKNPQP